MQKPKQTNREDRGSAAQVGFTAFLVVFVIVAAIGLWGFVGVDPGREKIVVNKGDLQGHFEPGWHWVNPVTTDTYVVSMRPQIYVQSGQVGEGEKASTDDSIEAKTVDGNIVFADIAIRYRVTDSEKFYLDWFHSKWGSEPFAKFEREKIRSPVRDLTRDILGTIRSETVYTGDAQQEVELRLEDELNKELKNSGATLVDVDVRNIRFTDSYQAQLEEKAKAKQQYVIQNERARADANAKIVRANADANATIIRAQARAKADRIRREELTREVIVIRQIEAYDNAGAIYVPTGQNGLPMFVEPEAGNVTGVDTENNESVEEFLGGNDGE